MEVDVSIATSEPLKYTLQLDDDSARLITVNPMQTEAMLTAIGVCGMTAHKLVESIKTRTSEDRVTRSTTSKQRSCPCIDVSSFTINASIPSKDMLCRFSGTLPLTPPVSMSPRWEEPIPMPIPMPFPLEKHTTSTVVKGPQKRTWPSILLSCCSCFLGQTRSFSGH